MQPHWEGDTRGRGTADGRRLSSEVEQFQRALSLPDWVAEEPELHLLPHLQMACDRPGADFALESTDVDADGTFVVTLRSPNPRSTGQIRAALFALVGQIAETATYVRQRPGHGGFPDPTQEVVFEVATGTPAGEGPYTTHGHLVRFRIQPPTRT